MKTIKEFKFINENGEKVYVLVSRYLGTPIFYIESYYLNEDSRSLSQMLYFPEIKTTAVLKINRMYPEHMYDISIHCMNELKNINIEDEQKNVNRSILKMIKAYYLKKKYIDNYNSRYDSKIDDYFKRYVIEFIFIDNYKSKKHEKLSNMYILSTFDHELYNQFNKFY